MRWFFFPHLPSLHLALFHGIGPTVQLLHTQIPQGSRRRACPPKPLNLTKTCCSPLHAPPCQDTPSPCCSLVDSHCEHALVEQAVRVWWWCVQTICGQAIQEMPCKMAEHSKNSFHPRGFRQGSRLMWEVTPCLQNVPSLRRCPAKQKAPGAERVFACLWALLHPPQNYSPHPAPLMRSPPLTPVARVVWGWESCCGTAMGSTGRRAGWCWSCRAWRAEAAGKMVGVWM